MGVTPAVVSRGASGFYRTYGSPSHGVHSPEVVRRCAEEATRPPALIRRRSLPIRGCRGFTP